jgi:hypothetical protein
MRSALTGFSALTLATSIALAISGPSATAQVSVSLRPQNGRAVAPELNSILSAAPSMKRFAVNLQRTLDATIAIDPAAPVLAGPAPAASPAPAPGPVTPPAPACTVAFIRTYLAAANEISTVANFVKADEDVPNLNEAAFACARIESSFPAMTCSVAQLKATVSTIDFKDVCGVIGDLYKEANGGKSVDPSPLNANLVDDATSIVRLEPARLSLTVRATSDLQKAMDSRADVSIIGGHSLDLRTAINSDSTIRCMFNAPKDSKVIFKLGDVLKIESIVQSFHSGYREAELSIAGSTASILCMTESEEGVKLGELKGVFNGLLSIGYAK